MGLTIAGVRVAVVQVLNALLIYEKSFSDEPMRQPCKGYEKGIRPIFFAAAEIKTNDNAVCR